VTGQLPQSGRRRAALVPAVLPGGEWRWPPLAAVLVVMAANIALRIWLPGEGDFRVPWLLPAVEAGLLVALIVSDPGNAEERRRLRRLALTLVGLLVAAALWATAVLVHDLIKGTGVANHADELLATGAVVWVGNNVAFALLYWLMDGDGPVARSRRAGPVDFAFTQQMSPELGAARLATRLPRLPAPRLHQRDGVQPDGRDAAHPPRRSTRCSFSRPSRWPCSGWWSRER
jgi:hypothetical protein